MENLDRILQYLPVFSAVCCQISENDAEKRIVSLWWLNVRTVYSRHKAENECCDSEVAAQQVADIVVFFRLCLCPVNLQDINT